MAKKIMGGLLTDHLAHVVSATEPDKIKTIKSMQCSGLLHTFSAHIDYGNPANPHRPYMRLSGHIYGVKGSFPCGVDEIVLGDKNTINNAGPRATFLIEFSQSELAELCEKGLFTKDFECPDIFVNNNFVLPIRCDVQYLESFDENQPLMFVGICDQYNIQMNAVDTGYNLTEYFEDQNTNEMPVISDENYEVLESEIDDEIDDEIEDKIDDEIEDKIEVSEQKEVVSEPQDVEEKPVIDIDLQEHYANVKKTVNEHLEDTPMESMPVDDEPINLMKDKSEDKASPKNVPSKFEDIVNEDDNLYIDDFDDSDEFI